MADPLITDEALFAAYVAGDRAAFAQLFERHAPRLTRALARNLRGDIDAKDLVQQTFLQVHRARRDFDPKRPLRPWLMTIAMNTKRMALRKATLKPLGTTEIDDTFAAPELTPPPEKASEARRVRGWVAQLPEGTQRVMALHFFDGLSYAEVAAVLELTVSAVKVRAHRGYKRLRELMAQEGNQKP